MESTEEKNIKKLSAEIDENGHYVKNARGRNKLIMKMMIDEYSYSITEDTVSGMHLAQGKPHHAYQMNV